MQTSSFFDRLHALNQEAQLYIRIFVEKNATNAPFILNTPAELREKYEEYEDEYIDHVVSIEEPDNSGWDKFILMSIQGERIQVLPAYLVHGNLEERNPMIEQRKLSELSTDNTITLADLLRKWEEGD